MTMSSGDVLNYINYGFLDSLRSLWSLWSLVLNAMQRTSKQTGKEMMRWWTNPFSWLSIVDDDSLESVNCTRIINNLLKPPLYHHQITYHRPLRWGLQSFPPHFIINLFIIINCIEAIIFINRVIGRHSFDIGVFLIVHHHCSCLHLIRAL